MSGILGNYGRLPNYESCLVLDVTPNFFIGRTLPVSGIRFDPKFKRTGHTQSGSQSYGFTFRWRSPSSICPKSDAGLIILKTWYQWFLDAFTKLRIAVCPNIVIKNDSKGCCLDSDPKCKAYKGGHSLANRQIMLNYLLFNFFV